MADFDHIDQLLAPLRQKAPVSSSLAGNTNSSNGNSSNSNSSNNNASKSTSDQPSGPDAIFDGKKKYVPSQKFIGSKANYFFGTNEDGLGYHLDVKGPNYKSLRNGEDANDGGERKRSRVDKTGRCILSA
jgi:hypothetical protein